jgi:hypothetical protein
MTLQLLHSEFPYIGARRVQNVQDQDVIVYAREQIHSLHHEHDNQSHPQMESTNLCFFTALPTLCGMEEDHQKASMEILEYTKMGQRD